MTLARERGDPLYQMSVETDDPASLRVSEGAALSIVLVEISLSARGLKIQNYLFILNFFMFRLC